VLECRAEQGRKLRAMYRCLGWSRADCAKFLHVTERCLHNWEAGRHPVPYAAYRLLRIHCGMALPGREWRGWSISRGKLCTPEGHELSPYDANWWSLLVRRAEAGSEALRQLSELKGQAQDAAVLAARRVRSARPADGADASRADGSFTGFDRAARLDYSAAVSAGASASWYRVAIPCTDLPPLVPEGKEQNLIPTSAVITRPVTRVESPERAHLVQVSRATAGLRLIKGGRTC
jgi:hypothetical protein